MMKCGALQGTNELPVYLCIFVKPSHSRISLRRQKGWEGSVIHARHLRWMRVTNRRVVLKRASSAFVMSIRGFPLRPVQSQGSSGCATTSSNVMELFQLSPSQFQGLSG